jgi:hypothetical protein
VLVTSISHRLSNSLFTAKNANNRITRHFKIFEFAWHTISLLAAPLNSPLSGESSSPIGSAIPLNAYNMYGLAATSLVYLSIIGDCSIAAIPSFPPTCQLPDLLIVFYSASGIHAILYPVKR